MVGEVSHNDCKFLGNVQNENITHSFYTSVFSVSSKNVNTLSPHFKVSVNNKDIVLMGDTGATCSCINYKTLQLIQKKKRIPLLKT